MFTKTRNFHFAEVLPCLLPLGGAETARMALARQFLQEGHRVDLLLGNEPNDLKGVVPEGARVINFGRPRIRELVFPLARYLREENPDVIAISMWPLTVIGLIAHRFAASNARINVIDHNMLSIQYATHGFAHRFALRATLALTYPLAHARVAVSSGVADDLSYLSGYSRKNFDVIHNPLPFFFRPNDDQRAAESSWSGWEGPRILTVGRLKAQKNHALLIRAFKRLLGIQDARLMILGTGPLSEQTWAVARAEGVADKVLMPGATLDPTPYYQSADVFVLSSDYEGFGNVIIEALACGLPVVSTNCPSGPADILEGGRYGLLVPVRDEIALAQAMIESLAAPKDSNVLKGRAADFSAKRIADQYMRLTFPEYDPDTRAHALLQADKYKRPVI